MLSIFAQIILLVAPIEVAASPSKSVRQPAHLFPHSPLAPTRIPQMRALHGHVRFTTPGQLTVQCSSVELGFGFYLTAGHCILEIQSDVQQRRFADCLSRGSLPLACVPIDLQSAFRRGSNSPQVAPEPIIPLYLGITPDEIRTQAARPAPERSYGNGHDFLLFSLASHPTTAYEQLLDRGRIARLKTFIEHPNNPCGGETPCRHNALLIGYPNVSPVDANGDYTQMTAKPCTIAASFTSPLTFTSDCSAVFGSSGGGAWSLESPASQQGVLVGMHISESRPNQPRRNIGLRLDHILRSIRVMRGMAP